MPRTIVDSLKGGIDHTFAMMEQYLDICPDNIWVEKNGGWPVWQQFYHALSAVDFFITPDNGEKLPQLSPDGGSLQKVAEAAVGKEPMKEMLKKAKAKIDAYAASLSDANLTDKNIELFNRAGMDANVAVTLSMLSSHTMYHFGSCEAALRDHGLKGIF